MNKETFLRLYLSEQEIKEFVKSNKYLTTHQDIVQHLGIGPQYYLLLNRLFPYLPKRKIQKYRRRKIVKSKLATVDLLVLKAKTQSGKILLEPPFWTPKQVPPKVTIQCSTIPHDSLNIGDKILVRMKLENSLLEDPNYINAQFLRVIKLNSRRGIGVVRKEKEQITILSTNKFFDKKTLVKEPKIENLSDGEIVEIDIPDSNNNSKVIINNVLKSHGPSNRNDLFTFLAKKEFSLPFEFPDSVQKELLTVTQTLRNEYFEDLTHLPFVTIDPVKAKDRDDAICAVFPKNYQRNDIFCEIWIAIADVSSYVLAGSSIDQEAMRRGNSTYFADSVIPMLPEKISNDLCSLEEKKIRSSITLKIALNIHGDKINYKFVRSKILVKHNLSYEEVENINKESENHTSANVERNQLIDNLFVASSLLTKSMQKGLELNIPEPMFNLSVTGEPIDLYQKKNLESHKIVENFMIMANSCAAETLSKSNLPTIYRVHEKPTTENLAKLSKGASILRIESKRKKNITPQDLNRILAFAGVNQVHDVMSLLILQSMTQAYYTTKEIGHFGLNLKRYVHFTSPIRRYTDLLTHRSLYLHLGWVDDNSYQIDEKTSELICQHVNTMERNSMMAERQSNHRYIAYFFKALVGENFEGIVYSLTKNLIFFFVREFSLQGKCQKKENHKFARKRARAKHLKNNKLVKVGDKIKIRLVATDPLSGNLYFELE